MAITVTVEQNPPVVVLAPDVSAPLTVQSLTDALAAITTQLSQASVPTATVGALNVEWRLPAPARPEDPDWKHWARHYDNVAWQVTSIFTAGSVLLANGFINGRLNKASLAMLQAIAGASIALIVFQMFIVGAFRTYRYELYRMERDRSPGSDALAGFRRWSGTPWLVYCAVAWAASLLWVYQLRYLAPDWTWPVAGIATLSLGSICLWAVPPTFRK